MTNPVTTWGVGDYPLMARQLEPAALAAVQAAAIAPGDRVLDVATGTGNAALLAANRVGGQVVGIDFEPALLQLAEQRARDAGRQVRWLQGDLEALPVPDNSADVVLSAFGVMYAADHPAAAQELARVAAPHARVTLAAWTPGSTLPAMGQVLSSYLPPPPRSSGPPSRWGDAEALRALLDDCGLHLAAASHHELVLTFPDAAAGAAFLIRTAGHIVSEQQALTQAGRWNDLHHDLTTFVQQRATATGDHLNLTMDYLLATAINEK